MCDKINHMEDIQDLVGKIISEIHPDLRDEDTYKSAIEKERYYQEQNMLWDTIETILCSFTSVYDYRRRL
jgi:hypothetical protein